MTTRQFLQFRRYKFTLKGTNSRIGETFNKIKKYEMPERFKGTIIERWSNYWKNLYLDYKDVAINVVKESREHPIRASIYVSVLASAYYCGRHNPDETSFREELLRNTTKVMEVGESIRNPVTVNHINWLEKCYNEGIVRRLNLGLFSLIWLDNYDAGCALYKATCPYLKPRYITFYQRVIDIGFLDNWWFLQNKMEDYDVNESEFNTV